MFTRFRDSLVYPARIINFRKDSAWMIISYIVTFAILMSLGVLVFVINFSQIAPPIQESLLDGFNNEAIDCQIVNSELTCTDNMIKGFYESSYVNVYIDSSDDFDMSNFSTLETNVVVHKNSVIVTVGLLSEEYLISDLPSEFHNVDFNDLGTDSGLEEQLIEGVSNYMVNTKNMWGPIFFIIEFISNIFFIVLIILVHSWILKARFRIIPFKEVFKMSTYTGTAIFLLLTFYGMVDLGIFFLILFLVVSVRQTNQLTMAIYKVIKKK